MSLTIQAKVVEHMEWHICIAVIRGQIQLFSLLLGFATTKIHMHLTTAHFEAVGGWGQKLWPYAGLWTP